MAARLKTGERRPMDGVTVGFVGLGAMGAPMAARLAASGHALRLYDTAPDRLDGAARATGGTVAASPADAAGNADFAITMLPTGEDVARAALGRSGIADGLGAGGTLIDMGSSAPSGTVALAGELARRGIGMVDAPVSGGRAGAVSGSLTIMAGGDADAVARCRPLLEAMGARIVHAGAVGSGHALKSLNNTISAVGLLIAAEAFLVGKRFGLDPRTMADTVNASTGMNHATLNKMARFVFSRRFDSGFSTALMVKDLETALGLARESGVAVPLAALSREIWAQARDDLDPASDHTEIVRWLERCAGAELA